MGHKSKRMVKPMRVALHAFIIAIVASYALFVALDLKRDMEGRTPSAQSRVLLSEVDKSSPNSFIMPGSMKPFYTEPLYDVVIPHFIVTETARRRSTDVLFVPNDMTNVHVVSIFGHNGTVMYVDPSTNETIYKKRNVDNVSVLKQLKPHWSMARIKQRQQIMDFVLALDIYRPSAKLVLIMDDDTRMCDGSAHMLAAFHAFASQKDGNMISGGMIRIGPGTSGLILRTTDVKGSLVKFLRKEWARKDHRYVYRQNLVLHQHESNNHTSTIWDVNTVKARTDSLAECYDLASWNAGKGASFDFETCNNYALSPCHNHHWESQTDHNIYAKPPPLFLGRRGINVHYSDGRNRRRFRQFQTYELSDRYRIAMSGRGESCSATCARVTRVARGGPPAPDRTVRVPVHNSTIVHSRVMPPTPPSVHSSSTVSLNAITRTGARYSIPTAPGGTPSAPGGTPRAPIGFHDTPVVPHVDSVRTISVHTPLPPPHPTEKPRSFFCDLRFSHVLNDCTFLHEVFQIHETVTCVPSSSKGTPLFDVKASRIFLNVYNAGWDSPHHRMDCESASDEWIRFCWCSAS